MLSNTSTVEAASLSCVNHFSNLVDDTLDDSNKLDPDRFPKHDDCPVFFGEISLESLQLFSFARKLSVFQKTHNAI